MLLINIQKETQIKIGSLGKIKFEKGNYVYIGSAKNNIAKRIQRHQKTNKKKHWHIDYITTNKNCKIIDAYYSENKKECQTAKQLIKKGTPIKNLGSSDCKCSSHFVKLN